MCEDVKEVAKQIDPSIGIMDEIFDEVSAFNDLLENIPDGMFNKENPSVKGIKIFDGNSSLSLLYKLLYMFSFRSITLFAASVLSCVRAVDER